MSVDGQTIRLEKVTEEADAFVKDVLAILDEAAQANEHPFPDDPINIRALDADGRMIGGLSGSVLQGWLYVRFLAVKAEMRSAGIGAKLLAEAETIVRARGLAGLYLDTFDFQAPKFYLREGFEEIGRLKSVAGTPERIWFAKTMK